MAVLPNTGLETHPDGAVGLVGIVGGNWERLDAIFWPALTSADSAYNAFAKALLRTATLPTTDGAEIKWRTASGKFVARAGYTSSTAAALSIDMDATKLHDLTCSGAPTFTTANLKAGTTIQVIVRAGGSSRGLTFPGSWVWLGSAAPTTLASGKVAVLDLISTGTTDAAVLATWTVQP